jgi:hypothetical protein
VKGHPVGYATFLCDGVKTCGCLADACACACNTTPGCVEGTTCVATSVAASCATCLEDQYDEASACATAAEAVCTPDADCNNFISCLGACPFE